MPTVIRLGPDRYYFYSNETKEPPHIHIDRDDKTAKFWLDPVRFARNTGFSPKDLRQLQFIVIENRIKLLEAWNEFFST